ncbi:actinodin3 isoform X2 [Narcine bancroftii]|uniref:actinodin3 isoform X2 n=1 Tax=Narcine bancroftii TaxID=1343680 RepID=UPI003831AADE
MNKKQAGPEGLSAMATHPSTISWGLLATMVLAVLLLPERVRAVSLHDLFKPVKGDEGVRLESPEAADFLRFPSGRLKRHLKWYQQNPDFEAWYKYYQKIGHYEGLYEIDRIRLTYLQMRHLESVYGKDAPFYQYTIGMAPTHARPKTSCDPEKDTSCRPQPVAPKAPVVQPTPPLPKAQYQAPSQLSCNPHDPACLLQYFYRVLGRLHVDCDPKTDSKCSRRSCDPKYDPSCAPAPRSYNARGYECDPVYDPDCEEEPEEEDYRGSERHNPSYYEEHEDDSEMEDDEIDPYDPRYGYYGDPSYYGHNNPYGSSPNHNPYNSPNPSPYNSPNPYDTPYGSPHVSPYGSHYDPRYGSSDGSPYDPRYRSPYGSPYDPRYGGEDEDEGGDEDDEY